MLKTLRDKIKDKVVEIEVITDDKKTYNLTCWSNANCSKYTVYIRDKKDVQKIDRIIKESKELNICILDYLNFMIFEYQITKDYSLFD